MVRQTSVTSLPKKFKDLLRLPPVLRLTDRRQQKVRICMLPARVHLHSELPPSDVWTYDGHFPGPTIEVHRGQRIEVEWVNDIPHGECFPVTEVTGPDHSQNQPGCDGRPVNQDIAHLPAWTVVHLHGGRTAATSDGWTENAALSGQSTLSQYDNDQRSTLLWYHDHAMGITRLNVYAGLAGLYIIRDPEEEVLGLPSGAYEVPLLLQDRNLDTAPDGSLTGRLLHKIEDDTMEFFGPFTLVNGTIWPHLPVEARQYRLRLLNGSNARTYRLVLLDEQKKAIRTLIKQIGTDGGLLGTPVEVPADGLVLAPAERADLIVDFRAFRGQQLTLVNTAGSPFSGEPASQPAGTPDPENRLPYPEVMQFRVSSQKVDDSFVLPERLSSFQRLSHNRLPSNHMHRVVALVERNGMLTLHELAATENNQVGETLLEVKDDRGNTTRYRTLATQFEDTVNWFVSFGSTEVWKILNLTEDTHPFHMHLVQFQVLSRDRYNTDGFNPDTGGTSSPITFQEHGQLDANECGWKDVVRVNPGEMVSIAAIFEGYTGRYIYHCHVLEHEDHDMMRPYVVMPAAVMKAMGIGEMSMPMPMPAPETDS